MEHYFFVGLLTLLFNSLSLSVFSSELKTDCSEYDPSRVSEYTSSWMGNDQHHFYCYFSM